MQEEKTILEAQEGGGSPPYAGIPEAFQEWWRNSVARTGQGGMTRQEVAEMAYGAGCVLGAKYPELVRLAEVEVLPDLLAKLEAEKRS